METPIEVVAPVVENTEAAAPKETASPGFEILAKRESQFVRQQQELKREREEFAKKQSEFAKEREEYDKYQQKKKLAKLNPTVALEDFGVSYEELTDYQLRGGTPPGEVIAQSVKEQLAQFRKEHEEALAKDRDAHKKQVEEAQAQQIEDFKVNMKGFIIEKGDEFELVNLYQVYDTVFETIQQHFDKTQKVLSVKEAANLVETHLEGEADKAFKSKKLSTRYAPLEPKLEPQTPQQTRESVSRTLNNSMNSSSVPSALTPKNEEERIKRALAALGG